MTAASTAAVSSQGSSVHQFCHGAQTGRNLKNKDPSKWAHNIKELYTLKKVIWLSFLSVQIKKNMHSPRINLCPSSPLDALLTRIQCTSWTAIVVSISQFGLQHEITKELKCLLCRFLFFCVQAIQAGWLHSQWSPMISAPGSCKVRPLEFLAPQFCAKCDQHLVNVSDCDQKLGQCVKVWP